MANLKGEAKIVARQDSQNFAVTVDTLQAFMLAEGNKGHLLPSQDDAYDLGSPLKQWKDLYLTGNSIYLGGIKLSDDGTGQLHVENSADPNVEIKFDLSTSFIGDLKDVEIAGVEDGQVLSWNEAAGEWRAAEAVSSSLHFYGVIGTEANETLTPDGNETGGDFYLVHGTHQLTGWNGIADGTEVDNADMVVLGSDDTTWQLLNDVIGGGGVTSIVSETDSLVVDDSVQSVPRLSINNANTTTDGLMSSQDKVKLDEVDETYAVNTTSETEPSLVGLKEGDVWFNEDTDQQYYAKTDAIGDLAWTEVAGGDSIDSSLVANALVPGGYSTTESFNVSRKAHLSIFDEESGVVMSYRVMDDSWNDDIKFSTVVTDTEEDFPRTRTMKVLTEYKSGGNNEYVSLIGHVKYDGKYILFPRNRPFDQSLAAFDPNEIDVNGYRGVVSNWPNEKLLFAEENCPSINTATPLTSDNRYVIVAGQNEGHLPGDNLNTSAVTYIVDLENAKNDVHYKEFTRAYSGSGTGTDDRRAVAKMVETNFGGFSMGVDNDDGTRSVYLFQAGKEIKKVVINDLATLDVTLTPVTAALPFAYLSVNGARVSYKGRISGLSVFKDRYIIFFAQNVGIYSFDTSDDSLTLIYDITTNGANWLRYGLNHYDWDHGVPEVDGSLYFVPDGNVGSDDNTYETYVLRVKEDLTVQEIPFSIPGFGCDYSAKAGPKSLMVFNNNKNDHLTFTGDVAWIFDTEKKEFTEVNLPCECYGAVPYKNGGLILTPNVKQTKANAWNYPTKQYVLAGAGLNPELIRNSDFTENSKIRELDQISTENHDIALNNQDAINTLEDGLGDIINPRLKVVTEDPNYVNNDLLDHQYPLFVTDETNPYYHLSPQRFVLLARFYAGNKGNKNNLKEYEYGNDKLPNALILDLKTGKSLDITSETNLRIGGEDRFPCLRGGIVRPHQDGSLDVYFWIHNPLLRGNLTSDNPDHQTGLFRIHVPAESDINDSDPFAGFTRNYTNIKMENSKFTTPNKNPYYPFDTNISDTDVFQYNITPYAITLRDSADSNKYHYFFQSAQDASHDYATQRIMEVFFDDSDPDEGTIEPVLLNSSNGEATAWGYVGGSFLIKKDVNGIERCFVYSNPVGVAELGFITNGGKRKGRLRVYPNFTALGTRVTHPTKTNKIGQPIIEQKGIFDNHNKGDWSAIQWLNKEPLDYTDEWSCTAVYYAYSYGVVAVDLTSIVAGNELDEREGSNHTRLLNNYKGDLNSLHINIGAEANYHGYLETGTVKNMMRFNAQLIDSHGSGSVWFFDWKPGYLADNENRYSSNRDFIYARGAIEVRVNAKEDMIEVIGHGMGRKNVNTNVESLDFFPGSQGLCKMFGNTFILSEASNTGTITNPKYCIFNTSTKSVSLISTEESQGLSPLPVPDLGIVNFASNGGSKLHCVDMMASSIFDSTRQTTRVSELQATVATLTARIEALEA